MIHFETSNKNLSLFWQEPRDFTKLNLDPTFRSQAWIIFLSPIQTLVLATVLLVKLHSLSRTRTEETPQRRHYKTHKEIGPNKSIPIWISCMCTTDVKRLDSFSVKLSHWIHLHSLATVLYVVWKHCTSFQVSLYSTCSRYFSNFRDIWQRHTSQPVGKNIKSKWILLVQF